MLSHLAQIFIEQNFGNPWCSALAAFTEVKIANNILENFISIVFTSFNVSINLPEEPKSRLFIRKGWRTREDMRSSSALTMKIELVQSFVG